MVKIITKKNCIQPPKPANDNPVVLLEKLHCEAVVTITELEVIETYMHDILGEMIAANDNDTKR